MMNTAEEIEKNIKKISTTIKRIWMDPILWGVKTSELKEYTKHWERLIPFIGDHGIGECRISFVCGRKVYKYWVTNIELEYKYANIDGKRCRPHWRISFHGRVCTQPAAEYCDHRHSIPNKFHDNVPFCKSTSECLFEEVEQ